MPTITINSYDELLEFIKRPEITDEQAQHIACTGLKVIAIFAKTKQDVIKDVEHYIKTFIEDNPDWKKPLFLGQQYEEFRLSDAGYGNLEPMYYVE